MAVLIGTFALVFIGIGVIASQNGLVVIALSQGFIIVVMVSATAHISGGHLDPALTLGVLCLGRISIKIALCCIASQLLGALLVTLLLIRVFLIEAPGRSPGHFR